MSRLAALAFAGFDFDRHRVVDSCDLDEARELTARVFNPHQLRVLGRGRGLHARLEHRRVGALSLNRLGWGTQVAVDPGQLQSYYLISAPVQGQASFALDGRVTQVSPSCAGIVNATQRFCFDTSDSFRQVVVRIERHTLEEAWQALSGRPCSSAIRFDCALPTHGSAWAALEPVLQLLARQAQASAPDPVWPHLHARLAELLATTLLLQQPHSAAGGGRADRGPMRPAHVRKAEAWMLQRLCEAQTVSQVALTCGLPVRSLQAAFQRAHGIGPMAWLREQRLQAVHALLRQGQAGIAATALAHGFTHLGEFSRSYRQRFGQTPSATRARAG